jgi:predicted transcriptional regulator of viral defense system
MNKVTNIFKKQYGYAYLKDLKNQGVHTDTIRKMRIDGLIERVKPGLYKLTDMPVISYQGMIDICMSMPQAVVCLHSALSYYELTTTVPSIIMIALRRDQKPSKIKYPPTKVFYFSSKNYVDGIQKIETESGQIKIYSMEKTIVDCFRYRKKLGEDIAIEGLKNYISGDRYNLNKLYKHAKIGKMAKIIRPYVESMTAT